MNVKKFTAPTMEAALAKVKKSLGRDAVILHTRCFNSGGFLGIGAQATVEVTASDQLRVEPRLPGHPAAGRVVERAYRAGAAATGDLQMLRSELSGIRSMIEELTRQTRPSRTTYWPDALKGWYRHLCNNGASEEGVLDALEPLAADLSAEENPDPAHVKRAVVSRLGKLVSAGAPIAPGTAGAPRVVALVGPTGVGKTTTIAKLAAHAVLRERKSVGLVTLDTYRIAAVEQLRTYARIIDVPLEVALSPADLPVALERLGRCDLIFVDTAGRSQRDSMKMNDLKSFFARRPVDETHLVLSATAEREAIKDIFDKFSMYRPERVLLTKLDELPAWGKLLDIARLAPLPVSYLATGQDVPDDIETASVERMAALIAGEVAIDC